MISVDSNAGKPLHTFLTVCRNLIPGAPRQLSFFVTTSARLISAARWMEGNIVFLKKGSCLHILSFLKNAALGIEALLQVGPK